MQTISRAKKLEVAQYYLSGLTYGEIEEKTGVSHGSIANTVKDLENGELDIPGTPFDQVNDMRQLSLDLKKKGLSTSQAILGLVLFQKAHDLDIVPEQLDQWAQLISKFSPSDFPTSEFLGAAIKLHQLEKNGGITFETVTQEYDKAVEGLGTLKKEAVSLEEKRAALSKEVASTSTELHQLENTETNLEAKVDTLTNQAKELQSKLNASELVRVSLNSQIQQLQQKKAELSSMVNGKEESLARLNAIGFQDEDLLKIRSILEQITQDSGASQNEVKKRFFGLLSTFKGITELETSQGAEMVALEDLTYQKSILTSEIASLESKKAVLQGEIGQSASLVVADIKAIGENAVSELKQQADNIKTEINMLLTEALNLSSTIDDFKTAAKRGEASGQSLANFINQVREKGI